MTSIRQLPAYLVLLVWPLRAATDQAAPNSQPPATQITGSPAVDRAQANLQRIRTLVDQGALPRSAITEAEAAVGEAEDRAILDRTLYSSESVADITDKDADAMVHAARRNVDRQKAVVDRQQQWVAKGVIARSELQSLEDELTSRQRTFQLAVNRKSLIEELRQMALAEDRLVHAAQSGQDLSHVMIRYQGDGAFNAADLARVENAFRKHFQSPLPISAMGQTALHTSMGLDHSGRVDVALSPESKEGVWLRYFLENNRIPYLAFRAAAVGAATAPHIHIGTGSSHLHLASKQATNDR